MWRRLMPERAPRQKYRASDGDRKRAKSGQKQSCPQPAAVGILLLDRCSLCFRLRDCHPARSALGFRNYLDWCDESVSARRHGLNQYGVPAPVAKLAPQDPNGTRESVLFDEGL